MSSCFVTVIAGCGTSDGPTGTLVYSERDTQNIRVLDLETGVSRLIDDGQFASVSIAPDAAHVAYDGVDKVIKVADRSGIITPLLPAGGGCASTGTWLTATSLTYCISDPQRSGTMLIPALGATPRFIDGLPAVSPDGTLDAYVSSHGDLIVEHLDGSDSRVVMPSPDPTRMYQQIVVVAFSPDQRAVLVLDYSNAVTILHIVNVADGSTVDATDVSIFGTFVHPTFQGASIFSPDGSEILMQSPTALVAVSLATGAKRTVAPFGARISSGGAVFLDARHVLWVRVEDKSVGDMGGWALTLRVAGPDPADDLLLDDPHGTVGEWPTIAVSPAGFVAVPSDVLLVRTDGTVLATSDVSDPKSAVDILGLTPNREGVITTSIAGDVRYVDLEGTTRDLVEADHGTGDLLLPTAAYTPSH